MKYFNDRAEVRASKIERISQLLRSLSVIAMNIEASSKTVDGQGDALRNRLDGEILTLMQPFRLFLRNKSLYF